MRQPCTLAEDFAEQVNRPADDPYWRHAEGCPDCRARLEAYRAFLEDDPGADPGFDLDAADAELEVRLAEAMAVGDSDGDQGTGRLSWWSRPRVWYSLAAVLVAAVGLSLVPELDRAGDMSWPAGQEVLRGDDAGQEGFRCLRQDGGLQLHWPVDPRADGVVAVFFAEDMSEIARLNVGPTGPSSVEREDLAARTAYCQIFYLAGGDTLARGPLFPSRRPDR